MPSNLGAYIANLTKAQNYRNVLLIDASYAAILLQYNVIAGTGVLFTALAHGLSFITTDRGLFREVATNKYEILQNQVAPPVITILKLIPY
jgi:hypothetical protein